MYQIDSPDVASTLPAPAAPGTPGFFTDGDLLSGIDPTIVPAEFLNTLMLELINILLAAGIAPSKIANNQVLLAIEQLIEARSGNYVLDTGVANAYVVTLNPAVSAYANGLSFKFRAVHANAAACTVNAGAGPAPLLRDDGSAMHPGDIAANSVIGCTYDAGLNAFLTESIVLSQLGSLAKLNIGAGLYSDGAGNLAVSSGLAYLAAAAALTSGWCWVDTSTASFTLTLPASPAPGTTITFMDFSTTWGTNPWILARNGKTIMGQASDCTININDLMFSITFTGTDWRFK